VTEGATYASVGVDIGAGDSAVERIKAHVASTVRPEARAPSATPK